MRDVIKSDRRGFASRTKRRGVTPLVLFWNFDCLQLLPDPGEARGQRPGLRVRGWKLVPLRRLEVVDHDRHEQVDERSHAVRHPIEPAELLGRAAQARLHLNGFCGIQRDSLATDVGCKLRESFRVTACHQHPRPAPRQSPAERFAHATIRANDHERLCHGCLSTLRLLMPDRTTRGMACPSLADSSSDATCVCRTCRSGDCDAWMIGRDPCDLIPGGCAEAWGPPMRHDSILNPWRRATPAGARADRYAILDVEGGHIDPGLSTGRTGGTNHDVEA